MPATKFICPDGKRIDIAECLSSCPNQQRCMFLPTLRAVANSLDRKISEPTVTELIAGTRETFLKKTTDYAVDPASILYALHGQAVHSINERHTQGSILSEERLKDEITSGQFDLYGKILDADEGVLGDLKITSSFKLMKALGNLQRCGLKAIFANKDRIPKTNSDFPVANPLCSSLEKDCYKYSEDGLKNPLDSWI